MDDVGLTGLYIHDCRCLAKIADILGHEEDAVKLNERAEIIEERMEELWDDDFGMYLNREQITMNFSIVFLRSISMHFSATE